MSIYYGNIWRARDFPFLSQLLFTQGSNSTSYQVFNQTNILNENGKLDPAKLQVEGVPYMASTFAAYVLTQNLAITATITHMLLYNYKDLKEAWSFMKPSYLKKLIKPSAWKFWETKEEPTEEEILTMDPHHRLMLKYKDAPNWWYGLVFLAASVVGIICIYEAKSGMSWFVNLLPPTVSPYYFCTRLYLKQNQAFSFYSNLPNKDTYANQRLADRWAFIIASILASIFILFIGAQAALTGFTLHVQPIIQMIGAYLEPGNPLTNMQVLFLFKLDSLTYYQGISLSSATTPSAKDCSSCRILSWDNTQN